MNHHYFYLTDPCPPIIVGGSHILVIGQNPGQPQSVVEIDEMNNATDLLELDEVYTRWFKQSKLYSQLGRYLEPNWLDTGKYSFTNVVRCRTFQNSHPTRQMVDHYRRELVNTCIYGNFKAIICVGNLARDSVLGLDIPFVHIAHPNAFLKKDERLEQMMACREFVKEALREPEVKPKKTIDISISISEAMKASALELKNAMEAIGKSLANTKIDLDKKMLGGTWYTDREIHPHVNERCHVVPRLETRYVQSDKPVI